MGLLGTLDAILELSDFGGGFFLDKLLEIKRKRFQFLKSLYEITGGNLFASVNMWELGQELGFTRSDTDLIVQYLVGEGLVKYFTLGGGIVITHWGVVQVEEALTQPDKPTQYFHRSM